MGEDFSAFPWSVYNPEGTRVAVCAHAEDAAALVALYGEGSSIRCRRLKVWVEGVEDKPAAESYDFVAITVAARARASH